MGREGIVDMGKGRLLDLDPIVQILTNLGRGRGSAGCCIDTPFS